jgi:uncharacterized cysteine cluster protein YcgN (CxxCxxCC family)
MSEPFWKHKILAEMSEREWESLCDGCGRCCLVKLEDVDTGQVHYTDVACRLLDTDACRCADYARRRRFVPDCASVREDLGASLSWLPSTCAYRLLADGKRLPAWHPLVTGDPESVHDAGMSVRGRAISEEDSLDLQGRIVSWPE